MSKSSPAKGTRLFDDRNMSEFTAASQTRAIVEAIFRHKTLLLLTIATVLGVSFLSSALVPKQFSSSVDIVLYPSAAARASAPSQSPGPPPEITSEHLAAAAALLRSSELAESVIDRNWTLASTPHNVKAQKEHSAALTLFTRHLAVQPFQNSNTVHVTYLASSPHDATDTLKRLVVAFLVRQARLQPSTGIAASIAEPPTLSSAPISPGLVTNLYLGALAAMLLGALAVFFAERARTTLAEPSELAALFPQPILAEIASGHPDPWTRAFSHVAAQVSTPIPVDPSPIPQSASTPDHVLRRDEAPPAPKASAPDIAPPTPRSSPADYETLASRSRPAANALSTPSAKAPPASFATGAPASLPTWSDVVPESTPTVAVTSQHLQDPNPTSPSSAPTFDPLPLHADADHNPPAPEPLNVPPAKSPRDLVETFYDRFGKVAYRTFTIAPRDPPPGRN